MRQKLTCEIKYAFVLYDKPAKKLNNTKIFIDENFLYSMVELSNNACTYSYCLTSTRLVVFLMHPGSIMYYKNICTQSS